MDRLPSTTGRSTSQIFEAVFGRDLTALVVGGVEVADLPEPALARHALKAADFVVSLEVRHSEVTALADVVLPVAPVVEKPGTFVSWEGRHRSFEAVLHEPNSLTDTRILAGIAEELGRPIGFRTIAGARADLAALGPWDGRRTELPEAPEPGRSSGFTLATWRQLIDDGRGQDGQPDYRATARPAVLLANATTWAAADVEPGQHATIGTPAGTASFPTAVADLPDGVVWAPGNNGTNLREIGAGHGSTITVGPAATDLEAPA
nr:molybdopterin-dependent oxidoreductase [Aeromicrobium marinum]